MSIRFSRLFAVGVLAISSFVMTACQSVVTAEECQVMSSSMLYEKGVQHGKVGTNYLSDIVAECAKIGKSVDSSVYQSGFEAGLERHYCTADNAQFKGKYNHYFNLSYCPPSKQESLQQHYEYGKQFHQLEQDINADTELLKELQKNIRDVQSNKEQAYSLYDKQKTLYLLRAEEHEVSRRLNYNKQLKNRLR